MDAIGKLVWIQINCWRLAADFEGNEFCLIF